MYNDVINYQDNDIEIIGMVDESKMSKEIKNNDTNIISRIDMNNKEICEFYFKLFINDALYYSEDAYNYLDEEYRIKRFGNIENFKKYIENKKQVLNTAMMNKYLVNEKDNYKQYVILDNYGNYYIFKETNPMEYSVLLDYYTVDIDEFVEKFNTTNVSEKVSLNVHKFINMINYSDYNAAYNLLDETFRNSKFGSVSSFENYVKNNFYEINKADFSNLEEREGVYTIEVKIQNYTTYIENSNYGISKTFIVKLNNDGTCTMSFNV
ncbi:MAG: hypothetical protein IKF97_05380 [Clostridia bacterium]|nr:hypothetical protein [Clostridia bacterium]